MHPEKLLNYKFEGFEYIENPEQIEGFDKIPEAFDVMDKKPRDLIKPVVKITW